METQLNIKLQMDYLEKDNWAHLLKHWRAIPSSYKILHVRRQPNKYWRVWAPFTDRPAFRKAILQLAYRLKNLVNNMRFRSRNMK